VLLSTLHQSSFGSLYLIVPNRLHALWYTPLLPVLFFISCLASGISMILLESLIFSRGGRDLLPTRLRANLAKVIAVILALYFVVRVENLLARGAWHEMTTVTYFSLAFHAEMLIGFVIPFGLLVVERVRNSRRGLYAASLLVVVGFALNRMNTAITGLESYPAQTYFPSLIEIFIMLGITALGFSAFSFIVKHLPIFEPVVATPRVRPEAVTARPEPIFLTRHGGDLESS
jgi:Ni/Fe-hydrogenase subunit HybB-like protein